MRELSYQIMNFNVSKCISFRVGFSKNLLIRSTIQEERGEEALSLFEISVANVTIIMKLKGDMLGKVDFQKTVYLCQQLGVFMPFEFRWDKIGPYSFELAHFLNHLVARNLLLIKSGQYSVNLDDPLARQSESITSITPRMQENLARFFKSIRRKVHEKSHNIPIFMECLGSIRFIKTSLENPSKTTVFRTLRQLKPHKAKQFSSMAEDAWYLLEKHGL